MEEADKCIETFLELALQECWNRTGSAHWSRVCCRRRGARVYAGTASAGGFSPTIKTWTYLVAGVALESNLLNCVFKITGGRLQRVMRKKERKKERSPQKRSKLLRQIKCSNH